MTQKRQRDASRARQQLDWGVRTQRDLWNRGESSLERQVLQTREQHESTYMLKPHDIEQMTSELEPGNPVENVTLDQLMKAFMQVMEQAETVEEEHQLTLAKEEYLVEDSIADIRQRLHWENSIEFTTLFQKGDRKRKIITVFMALLELCRLGELTFQQQNNFGALWIFPKRGENTCNM